MPLTAITTVVGSLTMFGSWLFISQRVHANPASATYQTQLLRNFFFYMGVFMFLMFLPHTLLADYPGKFPLAMALGYVIGHIFFYVATLYIARLFFSIVPRLHKWADAAVGVGAAIAAGLTAFNAVTMIWGVRPKFDVEHGVTLFNAHPVVGVGIALFAAVTIFPTAILMFINGFTNHGARVRSFLLGGGLFLMMAGGPIHDNARTAGLYAFADIVTIASVVIVAAGVAYRMEQRISLSQPATAATK